MRAGIDQSESNTWFKPTATQFTQKFSRCYYSIEEKLSQFIKFKNSRFKNSSRNEQKYEKMAESFKTTVAVTVPSLNSSSDEIEVLPPNLS